MNPIVDYDRRLILGLAKWIETQEKRLGQPVHSIAYWLCGALYVLIWVALSRHDRQPDWMWYVLGAGVGAIGSYIAANEAVEPLEGNIFLTPLGASGQWAVIRLAYVPVALLLILPMLTSGEYSPWFVALILLETVLFGLLEYLLAFRIVPRDEQLASLAQLFGQFRPPADQHDAS